jgi:hypothetical protein
MKLILEECERGGDYARERYGAAMVFESPVSAREIVERQYQPPDRDPAPRQVLRNRYPATAVTQPIGYRSERRD